MRAQDSELRSYGCKSRAVPRLKKSGHSCPASPEHHRSASVMADMYESILAQPVSSIHCKMLCPSRILFACAKSRTAATRWPRHRGPIAVPGRPLGSLRPGTVLDLFSILPKCRKQAVTIARNVSQSIVPLGGQDTRRSLWPWHKKYRGMDASM